MFISSPFVVWPGEKSNSAPPPTLLGVFAVLQLVELQGICCYMFEG